MVCVCQQDQVARRVVLSRQRVDEALTTIITAINTAWPHGLPPTDPLFALLRAARKADLSVVSLVHRANPIPLAVDCPSQSRKRMVIQHAPGTPKTKTNRGHHAAGS